MHTYKRLLAIAIVAMVASTGFGVAANAQEPSWADDFAVASLAAEAGISREEAARRLESQQSQAALAERLTGQLGDRAAGFYLDRRAGGLIVNVLDDRDSAAVRAAGATPRTVPFSTAELENVASQLDRDGEAGRAGHVISIGVDPEVNAVVVTIPAAAQADAGQFIERVRSFGDRTRIEFSRDPLPDSQAFTVYAGGHVYNTATAGCTAGFATRDVNHYRFMLTVEHCVRGNSFNAYMFGEFFGQRAYNSPAYDTASIYNWYPSYMNQLPRVWHWNNGYVTVKGQYTTGKNWYICKSGITTKWTCGYVNKTGQKLWVSAIGQYVWNLTESGICSKKGDSGGPVVVRAGLYGYWWATGLLSAGTGDSGCTSSTKMWFVPVATALAHSGLILITG